MNILFSVPSFYNLIYQQILIFIHTYTDSSVRVQNSSGVLSVPISLSLLMFHCSAKASFIWCSFCSNQFIFTYVSLFCKNKFHLGFILKSAILSLKKYMSPLLSLTQIYKITLCPRDKFS